MHRLFLGCPVEAEAARPIAEWSASELVGLRAVPSENLHVTLLFFGSVDAAKRDELIALTREVVWEPLPARTAELASLGRSAVGVWLDAPQERVEQLEDRLVRAGKIVPRGLSREEYSTWMASVWNREDPLCRLALQIPEPENVQKRRRQRQGRPLRLHLTLARRKDPSVSVDAQLPPVDLTLDRLVLFESLQTASGVRYLAIAESGRS